MHQQKIEALAQQYADQNVFPEDYDDEENDIEYQMHRFEAQENACAVLSWLLKDYDIAERQTIVKIRNAEQTLSSDFPDSEPIKIASENIIATLNQLFPNTKMKDDTSYNPDRRWTIEVTERQLCDIIEDVEDIHRFLCGQCELSNATMYINNGWKLHNKLRELHPLVVPELSYNESYPWDGHGCPDDEKRKKIARGYGIYRNLRHCISVFRGDLKWNVYDTQTLRCEEQGALAVCTPKRHDLIDVKSVLSLLKASECITPEEYKRLAKELRSAAKAQCSSDA